jgi:hypothetical protein
MTKSGGVQEFGRRKRTNVVVCGQGCRLVQTFYRENANKRSRVCPEASIVSNNKNVFSQKVLSTMAKKGS